MLDENKHIFIAGQTRSGKTFFAIKLMKEYQGGVIFINSQDEKVGGDFIRASMNTPIQDIIEMLSTDKKINYIVSDDIETANKEVDYLIYELTGRFKKKIIFCIDEIADYAPLHESKSKTLSLARRGLGKNMQAIFICQTPADVSKTITKQCDIHVFFVFNFYDDAYFNRFKIDSELIKRTLQNCPKHSFIVMKGDGMKLYHPITS